MKKILLLIVAFGFFINASANEETLLKSSNSFQLVTRTNKADVVKALVQNSKAIVIFPKVIKIGLVFGGFGGKGIMILKTNGEWNEVVSTSIGGGDVGLQAGFESMNLIMFIFKDDIAKDILSSKMTFGTELAYSLGNLNNKIAKVTDIKFTDDIYVLSSSTGIFAGVSLSGSYISSSDNKHSFNHDSYSYRELLRMINQYSH